MAEYVTCGGCGGRFVSPDKKAPVLRCGICKPREPDLYGKEFRWSSAPAMAPLRAKINAEQEARDEASKRLIAEAEQLADYWWEPHAGDYPDDD